MDSQLQTIDIPGLLDALEKFNDRTKQFKKEWIDKYKKISKMRTPQVDGKGRKIINKIGNLDYIIDAYMDDLLDKHFPGWSWEKAGGLHFLGSEYVVADGHLVIIDEHLFLYGFTPPVRKYWGSGAARIQYKQGQPHTPEYLIDIDKNVKSANTNAKKFAINRLTGIGDDVYGKYIEEEGSGSLEEVMQRAIVEGGGKIEFMRWVQENKWKFSEVNGILGVNNIDEVKDFKDAVEKIKEAKGL